MARAERAADYGELNEDFGLVIRVKELANRIPLIGVARPEALGRSNVVREHPLITAMIAGGTLGFGTRAVGAYIRAHRR